MTLILTKAPPQPIAGMRPTRIIRPGGPPPLVHPHCRKCGVPVEAFEIDPVSSSYYLGIEVTCHGKTQGKRIPAEEAIHNQRTGRVIWFFD